MSDSTPNSVSFPITPNSNDKRPLPEIIADYCGFALAYVDHTDGKRYYAVQDWIAGIAQTGEPRTFWTALQRRVKKATKFELRSRCTQLPYHAKNGKTYQMDYANAETLYYITQRMDANKGLRDKVLKFLAQAGVIVDEMRIDPDVALDVAITGYRREGKSERAILIRFMSRAGRNVFTMHFQRSMKKLPQRWMYAVITDELRRGVWKRTTAQLREQMQLKKDANLRNHQGSAAILYELLAETISGIELSQNSNLEFDDAKKIVRTNSESVGTHAQETSRRLGIDIATSTDDDLLLPPGLDFPQIEP